MALWDVYGSKSEYLKAPRLEALRVRLILHARQTIENEQVADMKRKQAEQNAEWERLRQGQ